MELQGRDLCDQALVQRRARLQALLGRAKSNLLRFSESFADADALLAECSRHGLEGIVAKREDAPYRPGTRSGWIKIKTTEWKAATSTARSFSRDDRGNSIVRVA
jgi:bifunctional non-homologous end joining protein LigD